MCLRPREGLGAPSPPRAKGTATANKKDTVRDPRGMAPRYRGLGGGWGFGVEPGAPVSQVGYDLGEVEELFVATSPAAVGR